MADFEKAVSKVLVNEGGLSRDLSDPGGTTNYGISLRFLKSVGIDIGDINNDFVIDDKDIINMSVDEAKRLYKLCFWYPNRLDLINDQDIATKCFDMIVNMGPTQAVKLIQRAIQSAGKTIVVDGKIGLNTINAINDLDPKDLIFHLRDQCASFYNLLVSRKPSLNKFIHGWLKRAYS